MKRQPLTLRDWWLPPDLDPEVVFEHEPIDQRLAQGWMVLEQRSPSPVGLRRLIMHLRRARAEVLAERPVASIVESLDRVAALWLNPRLPERRVCIRGIAALSGLSEEMVTHAVELEMRSSRKGDLLRALERELGSAQVLDDFVEDAQLGGRTFAVGPALVGAIFSSNIPALPHLSVLRALLVKGACLGRSSADEPLFLPLYLGTLARVDPELGRCVAALHWPHDDQALEQTFLEGIEHLIAYGSEETISSLAGRCPSRVRTTWHSHRVGFSIVLRSALQHPAHLDELAEDLAYDFSVYEQHACLSPQVMYVEEGGAVSPERLAHALAEAMDTWCQILPPRRLTPMEQGARRNTLAMLELRQAMGEGVKIMSRGERLQGVVVLDDSGTLHPGLQDRFVLVVPISSLEIMLERLGGARGLLQNVSIAGEGPDAHALRRALARLGVSRLCQPGRMATPSMMWQHDGAPRLAELVRWCDEERRQPGGGAGA